jgi:choline-sulfatase
MELSIWVISTLKTGLKPIGKTFMAYFGNPSGCNLMKNDRNHHANGIKALLLLFILSCLPSLQAQEKLNFVFIFADDLSYEAVGSAGMTEVKTPNLDRLAERGTAFTHAYNMGAWGGAVCVASRTMLQSGMALNQCQKGIKEHPQWSEYMKQAGYRTYMTGKWHVAGRNPKYDVIRDSRGGMPKQTNEGYNRPLSPEDYQSGWKPWDAQHGGFWQGGVHWSEVVANHGVDFIEEAKDREEPFFMFLAFNAPHDPRQAPKSFVDMYPLNSISVPENHLSNYPYDEEMGCSPTGLRDERLMPTPRSEYAVKVHRQEYFAIISHMDEQIGRILDALEKSGKGENTVVVFTSDHGLSVGHHGLVGKQNMYDHSMRVPFFIAGPGIPRGQNLNSPIYLQDAMATALDVAQLERPSHLYFQSLLPIVKGEKDSKYQRIYGSYTTAQRMVQVGDFKIIYYPKADVFRLYNLSKDPQEMKDLAQDPEHATILEKMKKELLDMRKSMGDVEDLKNASSHKKNRKGKKNKKNKKYTSKIKMDDH